MKVLRTINSFRTSFWIVPSRRCCAAPCSSAAATYLKQADAKNTSCKLKRSQYIRLGVQARRRVRNRPRSRIALHVAHTYTIDGVSAAAGKNIYYV